MIFFKYYYFILVKIFLITFKIKIIKIIFLIYKEVIITYILTINGLF